MIDYWSDEELLKRMRQGWKHGKRDTPCGRASTRENTQRVRAWLPKIAAQYGVARVCDAGAGDLSWIRRVKWIVDYSAFDLVPRHPDVRALDISAQALPECDLILCRMVMVHFDPARIERAISLFIQSGRYLAATQYDAPSKFFATTPFNRFDLRRWLGEPLCSVRDVDEDCKLALWDLQSS